MTIDKDISNTKPPKEYKTYMLSTCDNDYISAKGFMYPKKGFVYAKDRDPEPKCGNGLHGLLRGEGNTVYLSTFSNDIWQVLMVDKREVVGLGGKVKVPRAWVILSGTKEQAVAKMLELGCSLCAFGVVAVGDAGKAIAGDWGTATAGMWGTATVGYKGTATAGHGGTATAGYGGTATAENEGTANAGNEGTASAGDHGTATAGKCGTATAGHYGTANAGYGGTARAGSWGTATAGNGAATAAIEGNGGTATAGIGGTAVAGNYGTIQIKYWDAKSFRHRTATGYIGEDGLLPDVKYKVDDNGKFYEVK